VGAPSDVVLELTIKTIYCGNGFSEGYCIEKEDMGGGVMGQNHYLHLVPST